MIVNFVLGAAILGILTLFAGASSAIAELREALNVIWNVPPKKRRGMVQSVLAILKDRTRAFAMVLGIGFLLLLFGGLGRSFFLLSDNKVTEWLNWYTHLVSSVTFTISTLRDKILRF